MTVFLAAAMLAVVAAPHLLDLRFASPATAGGPDVLVAAAGLRRPRVLVSAGALARLDDEELAASLDHERGHIARGHRWLLLGAELARGVGGSCRARATRSPS